MGVIPGRGAAGQLWRSQAVDHRGKTAGGPELNPTQDRLVFFVLLVRERFDRCAIFSECCFVSFGNGIGRMLFLRFRVYGHKS